MGEAHLAEKDERIVCWRCELPVQPPSMLTGGDLLLRRCSLRQTLLSLRAPPEPVNGYSFGSNRVQATMEKLDALLLDIS